MLASLRLFDVLAWYCVCRLRRFNGKRVYGEKPALLALCPERFRGDLEALDAEGTYRIISCPTSLVYLLNALYLQNSEDLHGNYHKRDYYSKDTDTQYYKQRKKLSWFYKNLLPKLYGRLGVVSSISPNFTMPQFDLLGVDGSEVGYPYIVIHREGLIISPGLELRDKRWVTKAGKFPGDFLIVHNEIQKRALLESGYIDPTQIAALGCIRMDPFVKRVKKSEGQVKIQSKTKRLVLFSFTPGQGLVGMSGLKDMSNFPENREDGLWELFFQVHAVVAEIAAENPDLSVVIKAKWLENWYDVIAESLGRVGLRIDDLTNLTVTDTQDAQELILGADVVTSYGSTTLIEAGIAGKAVVLPIFEEAENPEYAPYVFFCNHLDLFDVARSREQFKEMLEDHLFQPQKPTAKTMERRWQIFNDYVSDINGGALSRYIDSIERRIEMHHRDVAQNEQVKLGS